MSQLSNKDFKDKFKFRVSYSRLINILEECVPCPKPNNEKKSLTEFTYDGNLQITLTDYFYNIDKGKRHYFVLVIGLIA